jgi:DNA-binding NarL/FixJ family response regulator
MASLTLMPNMCEMTISLSPKEKQIIHALAVEGKTVKRASSENVFICKRTADEILKRVKDKCGVTSTYQLIHFLTKHNLI